MPDRSTTARITAAARSSGRTPASAPPYRPIGVRTASTIQASRIGRCRSRVMASIVAASASIDARGEGRRARYGSFESASATIDSSAPAIVNDTSPAP